MFPESTPTPADRATCRAALIISMIGAFQVALLNSSVNVALPAIAREFDATVQNLVTSGSDFESEVSRFRFTSET